ncbi:hypothetical protein [Kitasatospora kifunensis]|uniref:Uncharacterized protein n=1 Tax=Kitasatospora kifunensis TaxID=58351 RepID=A0A7W7RBZ2_KITKI|nr:hypothetical protein [Kitasatospora kifunensis]MBB4929109.1 hypothetical protein [Kitasatospora kifunensis]
MANDEAWKTAVALLDHEYVVVQRRGIRSMLEAVRVDAARRPEGARAVEAYLRKHTGRSALSVPAFEARLALWQLDPTRARRGVSALEIAFVVLVVLCVCLGDIAIGDGTLPTTARLAATTALTTLLLAATISPRLWLPVARAYRNATVATGSRSRPIMLGTVVLLLLMLVIDFTNGTLGAGALGPISIVFIAGATGLQAWRLWSSASPWKTRTDPKG